LELDINEGLQYQPDLRHSDTSASAHSTKATENAFRTRRNNLDKLTLFNYESKNSISLVARAPMTAGGLYALHNLHNRLPLFSKLIEKHALGDSYIIVVSTNL